MSDPIEIAETLARDFAATAVERDRRGGTPKQERDALRASGLLGLVVPVELGGAGATWTTALRAVRTIARADGSLGPVFGFQHLLLATVRLFGAPAQFEALARATVAERWFWGNALNPLDPRTTIEASGGERVLRGEKSFCSGARDADALIVSAKDAVTGKLVVAAIPADRPGIDAHDDWDNMGQRQTDSGSVAFHDVRVEEREILADPGPLGSTLATLRPLIAQISLVNVYLGIAEGALAEARALTRERGKAWFASGVERAVDDPYVLATFGDLMGRARGGTLSASPKPRPRRARPRLGARGRDHHRRSRGGRDRDRGGEGDDDDRGARGGVAHVRRGGRGGDDGAARARPLLAQPPHAHAARSRGLQAPRSRALVSDRPLAHTVVLLVRSAPMPFARIEDAIARTESVVEPVAEARLPTRHGPFVVHVFRDVVEGREHIALVRGDVSGPGAVLVRVHSECVTGDLFGSLRCDCGVQLDAALARVASAGRGVVVYLRGHEGRGIGLINKLHAYRLQDQGRDTVEANLELGLPVDSRRYDVGAQILTSLGVTSIRLMSNNPAKFAALEGYALRIVERVPLVTAPNAENAGYLSTKQAKLGHLLGLVQGVAGEAAPQQRMRAVPQGRA